MLPLSSQTNGGGKQEEYVGIESEYAADFTTTETSWVGLPPSVTSEVIAYIDERINTTEQFDMYAWNKFIESNEIGVMTVCPSNNTEVGECAAFAHYNGEPCGSASICSFENETVMKEVTADCEGINPRLPSCSFNCATFLSRGAAFDKCLAFTSPANTPTGAPVGPTSSAPPANLFGFRALLLLVVSCAMWIWCG